MESEFIPLETSSVKAEYLRNLLGGIPLWMKPTPPVSMYCANQAAIAIAKNKSYNSKNRHVQLRQNIIKQLLVKGERFLNYAKLEMNLAKIQERIFHLYGKTLWSPIKNIPNFPLGLWLLNRVLISTIQKQGMAFY